MNEEIPDIVDEYFDKLEHIEWNDIEIYELNPLPIKVDNFNGSNFRSRITKTYGYKYIPIEGKFKDKYEKSGNCEYFKLLGKLGDKHFYFGGIYKYHWHDSEYIIRIYLSDNLDILLKYIENKLEISEGGFNTRGLDMFENIHKL